MKYNMKSIMKRAHALARVTIDAEAATGADVRYTYAGALAEALRHVWRTSDVTTADAMNGALDGETLYASILRTVWYLKRRDLAECRRDGTPMAPVLDWVKTDDDARAVAHGAYINLAGMAESEKYAEQPFFLASMRAVYNAARKIKRAELKHANALRTRADDDGDTLEYVIDHAAPMAARVPGPEAATLAKDTLARLPADELDTEIVSALLAGYRPADVARARGVARSTITRRLDAMRRRLDAAAG